MFGVNDHDHNHDDSYRGLNNYLYYSRGPKTLF